MLELFTEQRRARFWAKVSQGGGLDACWEWTGEKTPKGYGRVRVVAAGELHRAYAHRVSWELTHGPIADGLTIDHLCRNRACVNPKHMEPVTGRENTLRGQGASAVAARQTHCRQGHPLSGDNMRVLRNGRKQAAARVCMECKRAKVKANYWRKKNAMERPRVNR